MCAFPFASVAIEIPPGNPVLAADDGRILADQWREPRRHTGQAMCFERHKDDVGGSDCGGIGAGLDSDLEVSDRAGDSQPALLNRLQVRSAGDQCDLLARSGEHRADEGTNRTRSNDGKSHASFSATILRWIFPVAVRGIASTMW